MGAYSWCRESARVAWREGFEAIRYPSATDAGENLAIFYDRRRTGPYVLEKGREELPLEGQ